MQFENISPAEIQSRLADIATYELPESTGPVIQPVALPRGRTLGAPVGTPDASVVDAGVIAFVSGMSEQNKEDVRNSYQYASMVASKRYPDRKDGEKWNDLFVEVMSKIGWVFIDRRYDQLDSSNFGLTIDKAGLSVIASVVASAALPATIGPNLLKACGAALDVLKASDDKKPLDMLKVKATDKDGGRFCMAGCAEDEDKEVIMAFGAVHYLAPERKGNILFLNWDRSVTSIYSAKARIALNPSVYEMARPLIKKALGQNVETAIAHYEI